jgi:hypothetical protein
MNNKINIGKIAKTACIIFSLAFIITLTSYLVLNFILQAEEIYYLGIATLILLFPFLLSIAYVMAVTAKHMLEKGIIRLKIEEESNCPIAEDKPTLT